MTKATWKDHKVYQIESYTASGWARISFFSDYYHSPWTGTGGCYVPIEEIILEEGEDDD